VESSRLGFNLLGSNSNRVHSKSIRVDRPRIECARSLCGCSGFQSSPPEVFRGALKSNRARSMACRGRWDAGGDPAGQASTSPERFRRAGTGPAEGKKQGALGSAPPEERQLRRIRTQGSVRRKPWASCPWQPSPPKSGGRGTAAGRTRSSSRCPCRSAAGLRRG
jgi:hypothetical protein